MCVYANDFNKTAMNKNKCRLSNAQTHPAILVDILFLLFCFGIISIHFHLALTLLRQSEANAN